MAQITPKKFSMDSMSQPFSYYEHLGKEAEVVGLNSQNSNASQVPSQSSMPVSNQFAPPNMGFNPNFMMTPPFHSHGHSPFGYGFPFQDHLHSSNIPMENHGTKISSRSEKSKRVSQATSCSQKVASSKNWSKDEDVALTEAWLYISVDADVGNNQKIAHMWTRILHIWREKMGNYDESRTLNSLQSRWSKILAAVNKFHALYERLHIHPKSGASQEDMRREAMRMYEDTNDGQSFKYEHSWEIMKKNSKWCTKQVSRTKDISKEKASGDAQMPTPPASSDKEEHISINIDGTNDGKGVDIERPQGRKGTKEKKEVNDEKGVVDVLNKLHVAIEKQVCVSEEELKMKKEKELKLLSSSFDCSSINSFVNDRASMSDDELSLSLSDSEEDITLCIISPVTYNKHAYRLRGSVLNKDGHASIMFLTPALLELRVF